MATSVRRILLPALEEGWDELVDEKDRDLLRNLLSMCRAAARFRQPRPAKSAAPSAAVPAGTTFLRPMFGEDKKRDVRMRDADADDDDDDDDDNMDKNDASGAEANAFGDSVDYLISPDPSAQCYLVNVLFPRDILWSAPRLALLMSLSLPHIPPDGVTFGIDLETGRHFVNICVHKSANLLHLNSRLVIIEQLGSGPAFRTTDGLPLADGVTVHRTQDGVVISNYGNGRSTKRARPF